MFEIFSNRITTLILSLLVLNIFGCSNGNIKDDKSAVGDEIVQEDTTTFQYVWHWKEAFTDEEKEKVKTWMSKVRVAAIALYGDYPFDVHVYIKRMKSRYEPVPWAFATRVSGNRGIVLNIDLSYSLEDFNSDWVGPHELSHLSIPFIGREHSWFTEGYASFMQYQLMAQMGSVNWSELNDSYNRRIGKVKKYYDSDLPFDEMAGDLRARYRYPEMYWGSASYFVRADRMLKTNHNMSFTDVIKEYQFCCREKEESIDEMVGSWDNIIGDSLFTNLLRDYTTLPSREMLIDFQSISE